MPVNWSPEGTKNMMGAWSGQNLQNLTGSVSQYNKPFVSNEWFNQRPGSREEIEAALLFQMGNQYATYSPQINSQLYKMSRENPGYFDALWGRQSREIMRGGEQLLGGTLTGLQRSGMINSGQSANLLAGLQRGQGEAMGNAYLQNQMSEDERQRMLLALLGGQVNPLGGQALAGYGQMAQRDLARQQAENQRNDWLSQALGTGLTIGSALLL